MFKEIERGITPDSEIPEVLPEGSEIFIKNANHELGINIGWSKRIWNGAPVAGLSPDYSLYRIPISDPFLSQIDSVIENLTASGSSFILLDVYEKAVDETPTEHVKSYLKVRKYILDQLDKVVYNKLKLEGGGFLYSPLETPEPEPLQPQTIYHRHPDKRGSITIPKNLLEELGWGIGDIVFAKFSDVVDQQTVLFKEGLRARTSYTIDKNRNIRVTASMLPDYSVGFKVFKDPNSERIMIEGV